uniref:Uncharacterized protein n=1 Tax=Molossus molossus TaxID=27622 RepID=A0A7J8ESJ6_MOLMO|nr:hypothetical protein HJG59_012520 [Molossus molossus]
MRHRQSPLQWTFVGLTDHQHSGAQPCCDYNLL